MTSDFQYKTFGELEAGDVIFDEQGNPVIVKNTYAAHIPERMYKLELEDGSILEASGNHLWYVETLEDRLQFGERLQQARSFLSTAPEKLFTGLEEIAELKDSYEVTFLDILDLFDYLPNYFDYQGSYNQAYHFVKRVLLSLGHIVEHEQQMVDMATGEMGEKELEKLYDGRAIAQQILALSGKKVYRHYGVIKGRVITTDELFKDYQDVDIPVLQEAKKTFPWRRK